MNLYEIARDLALVLNDIGQQGGEITPEQEQELDALKIDLAVKVDGCVKHHRHLQLQADLVDKEMRRLADLKAQIERRAESFANYVRRCVGNNAKIETSIGRVWFSRSERTHVDEVLKDTLPEEYRTYKTTWRPKLTALHDAVTAGTFKHPAVSIEERFTMRISGGKRTHRNSNREKLQIVNPLCIEDNNTTEIDDEND